MTYLATFHWGWLLASLLLGFAMGWIAVVHRGQGVSKPLARWLAVLAAALVAAALARVVPGRAGYWLDLGLVMFASIGRLRGGIMAARPVLSACQGRLSFQRPASTEMPISPQPIIGCSVTTMPGPMADSTRRQRGSPGTIPRRSRRLLQSVHGTLNHLLVTDRIWMQRFTGGGARRPAGCDPVRAFDELRAAREVEDRRIVDLWTGSMTDASQGPSDTAASPRRANRAAAGAGAAHWFNHQTHHRGQVHALSDRPRR